MTAKEYFEGVRSEVVKVSQTHDMLERMKARAYGHGQSFEPTGGSGHASDPMAVVDRYIAFEQRLRERERQADEVVDEACEILYGRDNRGGLARLKGTRYADAVCMLYVINQPMAEITEIMQCSPKWVRELCNESFRFIDSVGVARVKDA